MGLSETLRRQRNEKRMRRFNRQLTKRMACSGPFQRSEVVNGRRIQPCNSGVVPKYAWEINGRLVCDACEKTYPDTVQRKRFYHVEHAVDQAESGPDNTTNEQDAGLPLVQQEAAGEEGDEV